jgi:hypothetical protein
MKKTFFKIFSLLTLVFTLSTLAVLAQAHRTLKATVPFNFVVNERVYPAGDYLIETVYLAGSQSLKLQSADGHLTAFLPTRAIAIDTRETQAKLVFNKFAEQYYLAEIFGIEEKFANQVSLSNRQLNLAKQTDESAKETWSITAHRK